MLQPADLNFTEDDAVEVVEETPEELAYLRGLDPNNWKEQDHYHVLGLQDSRSKATEKDIKAAFRRKVSTECSACAFAPI